MSNINIKVIEGTGFLAKKFKRYSVFLKKLNTVVYAAGVSNSTESNQGPFKREILRFKRFTKLNEFNKKKLIYISTYSIMDKTRKRKRYVKNKILIENLIKKKINNYLIIRLPEIIGHNKNPHTLSNFFYKKIKNKKKFIIWKNVKRNFLDVDDAVKLCVYFIKNSKSKKEILNILNVKFYRPLQIVRLFEKILKLKSHFKILEIKRIDFKIYNSVKLNILKKLNIKLNNQYLELVLKKYYK
jgi:nucleoside-diphosphate-sugar epimerase